jgi:hypothetical protein
MGTQVTAPCNKPMNVVDHLMVIDSSHDHLVHALGITQHRNDHAISTIKPRSQNGFALPGIEQSAICYQMHLQRSLLGVSDHVDDLRVQQGLTLAVKANHPDPEGGGFVNYPREESKIHVPTLP